MTTKFKIKSFFPLICLLFILFGLVNYVIYSFDETNKTPPLHGFPLITLLLFVIIWLFFGEFRTKMIKVIIKEDYLLIKKFGGLFISKKFYYKELDGFKISVLTSTASTNEYLYLIKDGRKVGKLSDFYHKNYIDIKEEVKTKLTDLGVEKFSYIDEIKEIFI